MSHAVGASADLADGLGIASPCSLPTPLPWHRSRGLAPRALRLRPLRALWLLSRRNRSPVHRRIRVLHGLWNRDGDSRRQIVRRGRVGLLPGSRPGRQAAAVPEEGVRNGREMRGCTPPPGRQPTGRCPPPAVEAARCVGGVPWPCCLLRPGRPGSLPAQLTGPVPRVCCSGRKRAALLYVLTYTIGCFTKHVPNFWVLFFGRILCGIATSLLYSVFESWVVSEHIKVRAGGDECACPCPPRGMQERWGVPRGQLTWRARPPGYHIA